MFLFFAPVNTSDAEVCGRLNRTLCALPVDALLHRNTTARALPGQTREQTDVESMQAMAE